MTLIHKETLITNISGLCWRPRSRSPSCAGAELSRSVSRLESPFGHRSLSFETSGALHEYPGKVLPLNAEDNEPQDRYDER